MGDSARDSIAIRDPWQAWRKRTRARIALGRAGAALPTDALLAFQLDHARARDAVHHAFDVDALIDGLGPRGADALRVRSRAADRATYLLRPDLGRRLDDASVASLEGLDAGGCDVVVVMADGLSAAAVAAHAPAVLDALVPALDGLSLAPVVIAREARVALGDEVGALLHARLVVVLIGERPGLTSPDSLGAYLTFAPRVGRHDAERNCVSNIRPEGLTPGAAARRIAWLVRAALARSLTGVALKDESGIGLVE